MFYLCFTNFSNSIYKLYNIRVWENKTHLGFTLLLTKPTNYLQSRSQSEIISIPKADVTVAKARVAAESVVSQAVAVKSQSVALVAQAVALVAT